MKPFLLASVAGAYLLANAPATASTEWLMQFSDETTAQADPVVGTYWTPPYMRRGIPQPGYWCNACLPGQQVWHPSQNNVDGSPNLLSGFWIAIQKSGEDLDLNAHPNLKVKWDDTVKGPPPLANPANFDMSDTDMEPVWSGSTGPFANSP